MIVGPQGIEPYKAGEIAIYADSAEGSLNGYLVDWVPEELTPEVIKEVQDLVARSEQFALDAGEQAVAASSSATRAETAANKAEQTLSISLLKDQNLADLSDKVQARINLSVDRLKQSADSSRIYDPTNRYNLVVMDTGSWGVYDDTYNMFKPLGISAGGTGAWNAEGARNNIGALSKGGDTATAMIATKHSYPAGSSGQILGWSWRSIAEGFGIGTATADFYVNHIVGSIT